MAKALPVALFMIDDLIRRGRTGKARAALKEYCTSRITRANLLPAASLARRLELPELGIKLLHPLVRPLGKRAAAVAEPMEVAEYAANLVRLGAPWEALELLSHREIEKLPEAFLYRAFALVSLWDYAGSIPLLEKYLSLETPDRYQRLVAKANLAAALLFERRFSEGDGVLEELERETKQGGFHLLLGNVLKMRAQTAIGSNDPTQGERWLNLAETHMRELGQRDNLFLKKWRAILLVKTAPQKAIPELEAVAKLALRTKHWETVRDCEGYLALAQRSLDRMWGVYFGTPFPAFREKLLHFFTCSRTTDKFPPPLFAPRERRRKYWMSPAPAILART